MQKLIYAVVIGGLLLIAESAFAATDHPAKTTTDADESWTYQPTTSSQSNARAIIEQKAEIRAQQRMDRLAAMSWYGMSNSRPIAAATPFTSMYSPAWQVPGGRPFGWYSNGRPTFLFR